MKKIIFLLVVLASITSCKTLTSTTNIKPNESFVLGNNEHRKAKVKLKNIADYDIQVYHAPIDGGKHSSETVKPNQTIIVRVKKNTALVISNASPIQASVELFVTGDLGLSMGYKKQ
jgi:uncharacterized protein YxeA